MIAIPTAPWAHLIGDAAAWVNAGMVAWWQHKRWPAQSLRLAGVTGPGYFLSLGLCALAGAWLFGSANTMPSDFVPSHSIAGALAGGIVGVELWKWRHLVRRSTGGTFVLPIAVGIVVGRMGCLFSGLADMTHGVPSSLPWAVDLGDGVGRHPVQVYESLAMALFLAVYVPARIGRVDWAERHGFHALVIAYGAQRFVWEFLKPYPKLFGPLNVFHLLCLGLITYGLLWWRRTDADDRGA